MTATISRPHDVAVRDDVEVTTTPALRHSVRPALLAALLALAVTAASPATGAVDWTVYLRRAGPLRIGMTMAEARTALGDRRAHLVYAEREPDDSPCAYLQTRATPVGMNAMFQNGRLVRIEIDGKSQVRTARGARIGDSEARIRRLYGEHGPLETIPHKYTEGGVYLTWYAQDSDRGLGLRFETADGKVTSFRVGENEAIGLVEGCN